MNLELEIEALKAKLVVSSKNNLNLQEELSEAYRIKGQLANLHSSEVSKNREAEKQLKFFQGCVAAAFSERDHALMEAEKAKDKEELLREKLNDIGGRVDELKLHNVDLKNQIDELQFDLSQRDEHHKILMQNAFDDEINSLRGYVDSLQHKLQVGLEIENHLKKRVSQFERKQILLMDMIKRAVSCLDYNYSEHKVYIQKLLDEGNFSLQCIINQVEENLRKLPVVVEDIAEPPQRDIMPVENVYQDVHISKDSHFPGVLQSRSDTFVTLDSEICSPSKALATALQEKVSTLLLLSQEEERRLLEKNIITSLYTTVEELQRNFLRVANEKVQALMELAQMRREYASLQEEIELEPEKRKKFFNLVEMENPSVESSGKLRSLFKKTHLARWVGSLDLNRVQSQALLNDDGNSFRKSGTSMDLASIKIENAGLKECIHCIERLTKTLQKHRLSLIKVRGEVNGGRMALKDIISEAGMMITALGFSGEGDGCGLSSEEVTVAGKSRGSGEMRVQDVVSFAGSEMMELLIFVAQVVMETFTQQ